MQFNHFNIIIMIIISLHGESYSQLEKGVKKYDKTMMTIKTLVN